MADEDVMAFMNDDDTGTLICRLRELHVLKFEADVAGNRRWTFVDGSRLVQPLLGYSWADLPWNAALRDTSDWGAPVPQSDDTDPEDWSR